ncbi:ArnT family glycosyltransferase [candidate division KSB1 bacterium]
MQTWKNIKLSKSTKIILLIIAVFIFRHIFTFNKIINLSEEGYRLFVYSAVADGKVLFKDIAYHHGILSPYVYGFIFKLLGKELIVLRLFSLIFVLISITALYNVGRKILSDNWAAFFAFLSFGFYFLPFYDYGYPVSVACGYMSVLFIVKFIYSSKNIDFILSAFFCSLTFLHTPYLEAFNFSFSIIMSLTLYKLYCKDANYTIKSILYFILGIIASFLIFNFYFIFNSNLITFIRGYIPPILMGEKKTPYILDISAQISNFWPDSFSVISLYFTFKNLIYNAVCLYIPLFLFIFGIKYLWKHKHFFSEKTFIILLFTFLSLSFSSRTLIYGNPGSHNALFIVPAVFLLLYFIYERLKQKWQKKHRFLKAGFIGALSLIYIFIQIPDFNFKFEKVKNNSEGVKYIWSSIEERETIVGLTDLIEQNSEPDSKIACLDMDGLIYAFLTKRAVLFEERTFLYSPMWIFGTNYVITLHSDTKDQTILNYIRKVKDIKPEFIIVNHNNWIRKYKDFPKLGKFIDEEYKFLGIFGEFRNASDSGNFHDTFGVRVYQLNIDLKEQGN